MSAVELLQPVLEGGLQRNNFFNGRLLSAEDLRAEQDANRAREGQLARAAGDGVAWGMSVAIASVGPARPAVTVSRGLALNRRGDLLRLEEDTEVTLVPETHAAEVAAGIFVECEPPRPTADLSAEGVYVLVVSPASGYSGRALVSDPNTSAAGRGACGARFAVEYVQFRLVPMAITALDGIAPSLKTRVAALIPPAGSPARERLRNLLAHLCFGTQALGDYFADPLKMLSGRPAWSGWGALDAMRDIGDLTDCDVPIALVVLTETGVSLVDAWSVRRRLLDAAAIDAWRGVAGPRRVAEAEAAFLQFQSQLEIVKGLASPSTLAASGYFDVLPAGGWLPTGTGGFDWATFLGPHAPPGVTAVDPALLRGILERSWFDEPFALDTTPPVPVRVYQVPGASFVVFARAATGNLRVIFSPAPAASQTIGVTATAAIGPATKATTRAGAIVPIPDLPPGSYQVTVTAPDYQAVAPVTASIVAGRTTDLSIALAPLPNGTILVTAIDKASGASLAGKVSSISAAGGGQTRSGTLQTATGKWLISDLPAATYTLTGLASGFKTATLAGVGPTAPGTQVPAVLVFEPVAPGTKRPPLCVQVKELKKPPLKTARLCMVLTATEFDEAYYYGAQIAKAAKRGTSGQKFGIDKRAESSARADVKRYTTPGGDIVYTVAPWKNMVPLEPLPSNVQKWLVDWRAWLADELDDADIAKSTPVIYLDPAYVPPSNGKQVPVKPPGYAVFNRFGVPLAIKSEDGITKAPVEIGKAGLKGLPDKVVRDLYDVEIRYIDDIAWAWQELIGDATGDPVNPVIYLIDDAIEAVARINTERGYYDGVDRTVDKILKDAGILDDVALANADPEVLGVELGSKGFAMRLIEQARGIVSAESWSLEGLGLAGGQLDALAGIGIDSKGALVEAAGRMEGKADIVEVLGLHGESAAVRDAAVTGLANDALTAMAKGSVERATEKSVVGWKGVDTRTAVTLDQAGFRSIEDLAGAEPAAVAAAANITPAAAEKLVGDAKSASGAGQDVSIVAPVSKTEQSNLNAMFGAGKATVGAVAAKSPAELAPAFGGDVARASAVLAGIKAGLAGRGR